MFSPHACCDSLSLIDHFLKSLYMCVPFFFFFFFFLKYHIIHAVGPDLRKSPGQVGSAYSRPLAVSALSKCYVKIFSEFVTTPCRTLRFLPVSAGMCIKIHVL
jgi:hypothetical protein